MYRCSRFVVLFILIAGCFQTVVAQSGDSVFLFSYFKNNGEDGLHLAYSKDGYTYTALKSDSSFLKPTVSADKLMRDPCIIRGHDGRFHMVWTVSWNDKGIGYSSSADLVNWEPQQFIPVMAHEPTVLNCWAPEIFYENGSYMIYWASTIPGRFPATDSGGDEKYNHRMYYVSTRDFKQFTKAALLYEQGFNVIDATIQKAGKKYYMFLKDETRYPPQKNLRVATSSKLAGPYSMPSAPVTGDYWAEGPTVVYNKGSWLMYFDKYTLHKYGLLESRDLLRWNDVSEKLKVPNGLRHGTVLTISAGELDRLMQ
ncbi:MAG: glycosyl hydrolase [Sphingobacteriales bacterium]|nr:MAG: glycosyl hydrolase [Sphingobacteriales bacterium]